MNRAAAEDMAHDNHHMNKIDRLIDQLVDAGVSGQEINDRMAQWTADQMATR